MSVLTLYDAPRCPYCARARIVLAEKGIDYETVVVDLDDRPAWIYEKNSTGRVPVLEEDAFVLPESAVIMEYLDDRYPEPPLLPLDGAQRALARVEIYRFDRLSTPYYAVRRGDESARPKLERAFEELDALLEAQPFLTGAEYGLVDIAYVPWLLRGQSMLGIEYEPWPALAEWLERLQERPAIAAESDVVAAL
jgi:RNA polymerase-associated protein